MASEHLYGHSCFWSGKRLVSNVKKNQLDRLTGPFMHPGALLVSCQLAETLRCGMPRPDKDAGLLGFPLTLLDEMETSLLFGVLLVAWSGGVSSPDHLNM